MAAPLRYGGTTAPYSRSSNVGKNYKIGLLVGTILSGCGMVLPLRWLNEAFRSFPRECHQIPEKKETFLLEIGCDYARRGTTQVAPTPQKAPRGSSVGLRSSAPPLAHHRYTYGPTSPLQSLWTRIGAPM
jgi:hypothetical protein